MRGFSFLGQGIGICYAIRKDYIDGVLIEIEPVEMPCFASNLGRFVIYHSKQCWLTNQNHFEHRTYSIKL